MRSGFSLRAGYAVMNMPSVREAASKAREPTSMGLGAFIIPSTFTISRPFIFYIFLTYVPQVKK